MPIKDKNLYYVGGVVRDELLGVDSIDVDYCYEGSAIDFSKNFNIIKTNPDFGTVRVCKNGKEIDIASTRIESYPRKGHLPVISKLGCSLKEDLARRDFTINAMAKNTLTGDLVDYFGGLDDIKNKKLKVLHDNSFIDDPSRIIRGLKFAIRFGFELDEKTLDLQNIYLENINYDMSYHRLKKELKETFNLNNFEAFKKFVDKNIYKLLGDKQQKFSANEEIPIMINKYMPENIWLIYLGCFDLSNFELTSEEKNIIVHFNKIKNSRPNDNIEIYKLFNNIPLESILLYANFINIDIAKNYLENLASIKILTTGNDLINLGVQQGSLYKEIFEFLITKKIIIPNLTQNEEIILVKEFLKKKSTR